MALAAAARVPRPERRVAGALALGLWISAASVAASPPPSACRSGFVFARRRFPGRRVLGALLTLPVALPPLVGVLAFLFLYGESGFASRASRRSSGWPRRPGGCRGRGHPARPRLLDVRLLLPLHPCRPRPPDAALPEAAASLGAGPWRTLLTVTLPLLRPALAGAALLTFLTSLASFSAPYIFGGNFRVMTTQIVASKLNGDLPLAMVESVALAAVALAVSGWSAERLQGRASAVAVRARRDAAPGGGRGAAGGAARRPAAGWGPPSSLLLPHATLLLLSLVPRRHLDGRGLAAGARLLQLRRRSSASVERLRPVLNSLWMAAAASAAALALGFVAARAGGRRGGRLGRLLEALVGLPWAVPGTVFAVALAVTFSVDAPWLRRFVLVGTPWLLPLAYLLRSLPLTGRAALAGAKQLDPALEEAAASLGAGRCATLARSSLPLLWPSLSAGLSPRLHRRAGRLRHLDHPLHLRQPPDRHGDPLRPAPAGDRRGGGLRRAADGGVSTAALLLWASGRRGRPRLRRPGRAAAAGACAARSAP